MGNKCQAIFWSKMTEGRKLHNNKALSSLGFCGKLIDDATGIIAGKCAINCSLIPVLYLDTSFFLDMSTMKAKLTDPCERA